jgi:ribosomal protein S25
MTDDGTAPRGCEEVLAEIERAGRPITVRRVCGVLGLPTGVARAAIRHLIATGAIEGRDDNFSAMLSVRAADRGSPTTEVIE